MSYDETNAFARVLAGQISCEKVFENEHALAFKEVNPQAPIHAVVIPKGRYASFLEFSAEASPDAMQGFMRAVSEASQALGVSETGVRLISNAGAHAQPGFQPEVAHFHVHLLGGRSLGPLLPALEVRGGVATLPEVVEDDTTLVMLPVETEASSEQAQLLAKELELELYDVQRMFPTPLPRALRSAGKSEVEALKLRLDGSGLPLRLVGSAPLLGEFDPWHVDRVRLDGEQVVLIGAEGEHVLKPSDRGRVIRGRYAWTVTGHEGGRIAPFVADTNRRRGSSTRIAKPKRAQFAHLYLEGTPRPFSCVEDRIVDYSFLGEEMTASAHTNFDKLIGILTRGEAVTIDDTLIKNAMMVKVVGKTFYDGVEKPSSKSPDVDADILSRLLNLLAEGGEAS